MRVFDPGLSESVRRFSFSDMLCLSCKRKVHISGNSVSGNARGIDRDGCLSANAFRNTRVECDSQGGYAVEVPRI